MLGYTATAARLVAPSTGATGCAAAGLLGLAFACQLARRVPLGAARVAGVDRPARPAGTGGSFAARTAVPVVYFSALRPSDGWREPPYPSGSSPFRAASLTVLATTHMESGPANACRVASGMPFGGLAMLAFLSTFRFGCPRLGLTGATLLGYGAALIMLAVIGRSCGLEGAGARRLEVPRSLLLRRSSRRVLRETLLTRRRSRGRRSTSPRAWRSLAMRRDSRLGWNCSRAETRKALGSVTPGLWQ